MSIAENTVMQMPISKAFLKKCACNAWFEIKDAKFRGIQDTPFSGYILPLFDCPGCYSTNAIKVAEGSELHEALRHILTC